MMNIKQELWGEFAARHAAAVYEAEERKAEVLRQYPALVEMERKLTEKGVEYCLALTKGGNAAHLEKELKELQQKKDTYLEEIGADFAPRFACEKCQDTGMTEEGVCECFRRALIAENFRRSNLEQALVHQTFENFDLNVYSPVAEGKLLSPRDNMSKILGLCKEFVAHFDEQPKNLLFTGATGLGKTFLSTAIARALLDQGKSVIYISAPEFARRLESVRFRDEGGELEQFYEADMLIIDDLGIEGRTAYTIGALTDLMDRRIRTGKKMLFSTNLNLEGIQKAYDERIISRLLGHFIYCFFYGEDLRIKAFKEGK